MRYTSYGMKHSISRSFMGLQGSRVLLPLDSQDRDDAIIFNTWLRRLSFLEKTALRSPKPAAFIVRLLHECILICPEQVAIRPVPIKLIGAIFFHQWAPQNCSTLTSDDGYSLYVATFFVCAMK